MLTFGQRHTVSTLACPLARLGKWIGSESRLRLTANPVRQVVLNTPPAERIFAVSPGCSLGPQTVLSYDARIHDVACISPFGVQCQLWHCLLPKQLNIVLLLSVASRKQTDMVSLSCGTWLQVNGCVHLFCGTLLQTNGHVRLLELEVAAFTETVTVTLSRPFLPRTDLVCLILGRLRK